jgi:hypothetical protein
MNKKEFINKMENLAKPSIVSETHGKKLKLTLMNTQKSAIFGVFLVIAPFLFASGAIFKHELGMDFKIFTWFFDLIGAIDPDSDSSLISWGIRFLLESLIHDNIELVSEYIRIIIISFTPLFMSFIQGPISPLY